MNLRQKLIILFLVISLIPISLVSFLFYNTTKNEITNSASNQLAIVAAKQEQKINIFIQTKREKILNLSTKYQLRKSLESYIQSKNPADLEAINNILQENKTSELTESLLDITLTDFNGNVLASTNKKIIGTSIIDKEYFIKGKTNEVNVLVRDKQEQISIVFITNRVVLEGKQLGILIMSYNTDEIDSLISDYTGLGKTGETEVAEKDDNGDIIYIMPLRFDSNAAFNRTAKASETNRPIVLALNKAEMVYADSIDYRNQKVLAATRYIDLADWGLVVKIDTQETLTSVVKLRNISLIIFAFLSVIIVFVALYISKIFTAPLIALTKITNKIIGGDLNQKINISSSDEIGVLAKTFNQMTANLSQSYHVLEQKVEERTAELAQKVNTIGQQNENLEQNKLAMLNLLEDARLLEEELRGERDRGQGILRYLHAIGEGIIATDAKGALIFVNLAAAKMVMREEGSPLLGRNYASEFSFFIGRGMYPKPIDPVSMTLEKSDVYVLPQNCYLIAKSKKVPVSGSFAPIVKEGKTLGVVSVFQDITERYALEKEKDEFISIAAHQIRTPLTGIRWTIESLLDGDAGKLPGEAKEYLKQVFENSKRLIALVSDLLDVSKINMGKVAEKQDAVDICKMLQEAIKALRGLAKERKVTVSFEKICAISPEIKAGPKHFFQALENLLSNAIKYTKEEGAVKVSLDLKRDKVVISVSDNGIGIPKRDQNKIFSKFFRASNAVLKETDGSGLGLNVVRSFIEEASGKIWFESKEGKGTTFFVELPIIPKDK